jgi:hypothetical protein
MRGEGRKQGEKGGVVQFETATCDVGEVVDRAGDVVGGDQVTMGSLVEGRVSEEVAGRSCSGGGGFGPPCDCRGVVG